MKFPATVSAVTPVSVTLPAWGWKDDFIKETMSAVHLVTSFVLAGAVLLHVAGAASHALARDGFVRRMSFRAS